VRSKKVIWSLLTAHGKLNLNLHPPSHDIHIQHSHHIVPKCCILSLDMTTSTSNKFEIVFCVDTRFILCHWHCTLAWLWRGTQAYLNGYACVWSLDVTTCEINVCSCWVKTME